MTAYAQIKEYVESKRLLIIGVYDENDFELAEFQLTNTNGYFSRQVKEYLTEQTFLRYGRDITEWR